MSGSAPPELSLAEARRQLERKGYLRAGLPARRPPFWQRFVPLVIWTVAVTITLVGGALACTATDWGNVALLGLALLPLVAGALTVVLGVGQWVAFRLLRWGAPPKGVAAVLGVTAAGLTVMGIGYLVAWPGAEVIPLLLTGLAGIICGATAGIWVHRTLLRTLAGATGSPLPRWRGPWGTSLLLAVCALSLAIARFPPAPQAPPRGAGVAFSVPAASGRVAVVGVDNLSREDLVSLPSLFPGEGWESIVAWGWVAVDGEDSPWPAVRWVSLACGAPSREHGVRVMDEVQLFARSPGVVLPAPLRALVVGAWSPFAAVYVAARPALDRRLPTFWEMASRGGCPVHVGGWWGSWPVRQVLGEVISERAWLGGAWGEDAVTPGLAAAVRAAWQEAGKAAVASDVLATKLVQRGAAQPGPSLVALWLPALDLTLRLAPSAGSLALAAQARPHLQTLHSILVSLQGGGYAVWLVGMPGNGAQPFAAGSGVHPLSGRTVATPAELVTTWLGQLGLPPPALGKRSAKPTGVGSAMAAVPVDYGSPPPPLSRPPIASATAQREVLRNLGYLR